VPIRAVMMKRRERARQIALQALYQMDVRDEAFGPGVLGFIRDSTADPEVYFFARRLVEGVAAWRTEADRLIEEAAEHWRIPRMPPVDRNILRLATWEICRAPDIPERVAIDQAIELAKMFSSAEAPAFVNGVLDRVLRLACERGLVAAAEEGPAAAGEGAGEVPSRSATEEGAAAGEARADEDEAGLGAEEAGSDGGAEPAGEAGKARRPDREAGPERPGDRAEAGGPPSPPAPAPPADPFDGTA